MNHFTKDKHYGKMSITLQMLIMTFEAESVAYAVCQYFGIETGENSFGYIASWSKNKELGELYASLDAIRSTASDIIEKTEKNLNKDKNKEITRDDLLQVCEPSFFYFTERGKER